MGGFKCTHLTGCFAALLLSATPAAPQAVSRGSDVAQPTLFVPGFVPKAPPTFGRDSIPSDAPDSPAEPAAAAATYSSGLEGDNYIIIELSNFPEAGSTVPFIRFTVGDSFNIHLLGGEAYFVPGATLRYNLPGSCPQCYESIPPDAWKRLRLRTSSGDGLHIHRIIFVKSYVTLVDVVLDNWLDRYARSVIDFSLDAARLKWNAVQSTRVTDLFYAGQDLAQTGARKYVRRDVKWCSEFASYMIRTNGLSTPAGSIDTGDMKNFFADRLRLHTRGDVDGGAYSIASGDYMSLWDGRHSVLFLSWKNGLPDPGKIPPDTEFFTIEGNTGNMVLTQQRKWSDVEAVGSVK